MTSEPSDSRVPAAPAPARWWASRALYVALGWTCVAVGAIGVVVPLLPTTIFMIVALWAFGRGSSRFRAWLYGHPRYVGVLLYVVQDALEEIFWKTIPVGCL